MLIKDIYTYFSRFVPREALGGSFLAPMAGGYQSFRTAIMAHDDTRRIAGITAYVFGIDEESVQQRLSSIKGMYLFIDYGSIRSDISSLDVKTDRMDLAVTVAAPTASGIDQPSLALLQDECLQALSTIRRTMRNDYEAGMEWLPFGSSELRPFTARGLANSFGWTLNVTVEGVDIV